jgi:hypothetical protein
MRARTAPRARIGKIRGVVFAALVGAVTLLASAREASAYTQFQFSTGTTRCNQCHYGPAGTGLISSWGRDEAGDTISLGGDGAFLHGLWSPPSWLALGLDFRYAILRNDVGGPESPEVAAFPMQLDTYFRVAVTEAFTFNATIGVRGEVRPVDPTFVGRLESIPDRFITPEHYIMWRPSATGPYVRLGRFYAPYGLRLVEHIYYVRRYTGYNLYEQTYNLSGGYIDEDYEVHATAFVPVPTGAPGFFTAIGPPEHGGALYAERRFNKMASLALQGRVGISDELTRYQGGAVGKLWFEPLKVLFMGEGDLINQQIKGPSSTAQTQFVSYLGASYVMRGLVVNAAYERFQEDLAVRGTARVAGDFSINFFPWAHFELYVLYRYQTSAVADNGADTGSANLLMFQLHYYM